MTPIINPFYFYLIELCGAIKTVAIIVLVFSLVVVTFGILSFEIDGDKTMRRVEKIAVIIGAICVLLIIAIPSEKTAEKMLIAKYVTYENYDKGKQEVKEIVDYIFEKVEESKE